MNILRIALFLAFVPYAQIFILNPLSPGTFPNISPSLFIASVILLSSKLPSTHSYIYAFLLGGVSSILCGHPLAFDSLSFLIIVWGVEKFSENFDLSGFVGQFVMGFVASVFHFLFLFFFSRFISINIPSFAGLLPGAALTGILLAVMFNMLLRDIRPLH